jgi:hypothetical protein
MHGGVASLGGEELPIPANSLGGLGRMPVQHNMQPTGLGGGGPPYNMPPGSVFGGGPP